MKTIKSKRDPVLNLLAAEEKEVLLPYLPADGSTVSEVAERFLLPMTMEIHELDRYSSYIELLGTKVPRFFGLPRDDPFN